MRIFLLTISFALGCTQQPPAAKPLPASAPPFAADITAAQPKLATIQLFVGAVKMEAEQAMTERQIKTGMMFRKTMGENSGMIFVFKQPKQQGFWMKNCFVPMSAAYIDPQGRINEIVKLEPQNTNSVMSKSFQIQYVLEAPRGWFKKNGISPGVTIMTPKGTLPQTYFP
ncbi:MAG: DUF192 domain-containing protein [Verrucomicrobia subdivision 3 bacterium]|nr:DUF192 domain-containing protein [Limisphaerales bacterium]